MATEVVTPSAVAELTDLGKCLMKHEVGGAAGEVLLLSQLLLLLLWDAIGSFGGKTPLCKLGSWFLKPQKTVGKAQGHGVPPAGMGRGSQESSELH